ncbi:helix-turn-helix transcriptional regulator [Paenibacillus konkukensis]|nr:YafY family protein [Paenibacillus konkukensis]
MKLETGIGGIMRADRLISLIMHLQLEGRMTAKELARRLEVSERTIYRDIEALSAAGVPVYTDSGAGGGISLPKEYRTRLDGLTTPEIHALFVHLAGEPLRQLGIGSALQTALLKLLNALPSESRLDAEWIQNRIFLDTESWRSHPEDEAFLTAAQQAVWEEKRVRMLYVNRSGEAVAAMIDPYGLVAKAGVWFIVAGLNGRITALRLSGIRSFERTEEGFVRPDGFKLSVFWPQWVADWEAGQFRYSVVADFPEDRARRLLAKVRDVRAVPQDSVSAAAQPPVRPGWQRWVLAFENMETAADRMLALGMDAEVIEPSELREKLRSCAGKIMRLYS